MAGKTIRGYAVKWGKLSEPLGVLGGSFRERFQKGAFAKSLARGDEVKALYGHEATMILGSRKSGTLKVEEDDVGLKYTVDLPPTTYANDLAAIMERGDVDKSSFAFLPIRDKWDMMQMADGKAVEVRTVLEADLRDVSPVGMPAYKDSTVGLVRSTTPEGRRATMPTDPGLSKEEKAKLAAGWSLSREWKDGKEERRWTAPATRAGMKLISAAENAEILRKIEQMERQQEDFDIKAEMDELRRWARSQGVKC